MSAPCLHSFLSLLFILAFNLSVHICMYVCIHIHISVSICLSYDKMIRCKTLCLHVFFELVLHDTFELSVTHGKHIPFDISKRKIELEISTISTWCAHLIQIIYLIWFHNDIFFMAIFKYPHFNEIYGENKNKVILNWRQTLRRRERERGKRGEPIQTISNSLKYSEIC